METFWQDARYAIRTLGKNPGLTAVMLLTLALGIGANTAIFSVTYGILLKPLPYPDSSHIVQIWATRNLPQRQRVMFSRAHDFDYIHAQSNAFEQIADYNEGGCELTAGGPPESLQQIEVSGSFFSILGIPPLLGRPILPADVQPGHDHVALVGYKLWQRRFGGDPGIVGKQVVLAVDSGNPDQYTVIGVMPFRLPFPSSGELWLPLTRRVGAIASIARLKKGITFTQANAELHTIATRLAAEYPETDKSLDLSAALLRDSMSDGYNTSLLVLFGAVGFVLLLACVNVSSLLVARSWTRRKEIAIRETLGATRWRLMQQLLSESVLLALCGGALSLLIAYGGVNALRAIAPPGTPRLNEIGMDGSIFLYTLGVSVLGGILFGLGPAMQITRSGPAAALQQTGSVSFVGPFSRRPHGLRNLMAVAEISLAFLLLTGSILIIRSFSRLMSVNLGYRTERIMTMWVSFDSCSHAKYDECKMAIGEALERTRSLPGIENASFGMSSPFGSHYGSDIAVDGKLDSGHVEYNIVTPGFFDTLGISLLAGRLFDNNDTKNAPLVAVVSEALAKRYFDGKPLGKKFSGSPDEKGRPRWLEVVGVVGSIRDFGPSLEPHPQFYIPFSQAKWIPGISLVVRTAVNSAAMRQVVRERVWSVDQNATVGDLETMEQDLSESVSEPRFRTILLGIFAALGLALAVVGVYGVISYAVVQRTHEIGVRVALGAQPGDIVRLVLGDGLLLAVFGIGLGAAGALALTRFLQSLLFEIKPTDPLTFAGVALLLACVALAACYIPARRAMRVDPMIALRHE